MFNRILFGSIIIILFLSNAALTPIFGQDFKGALFINVLQSVINDDKLWFKTIHDFYQRFKYQIIIVEDGIAFFNNKTKMNLTPIFNQYLRHPAIPTLELNLTRKRA